MIAVLSESDWCDAAAPERFPRGGYLPRQRAKEATGGAHSHDPIT